MASQTLKEPLFSAIVLLTVVALLVDGQTLPDVSECGRNVGCFRNPANCSPADSCTAVLRWYKSNDSNYITFDLTAMSDGWVAFGLSMDQYMGSDSVMHCIRNSSNNDSIIVGLSYNPATYNTPLMPNTTMQYLMGQTASYVNGRVICSFQRSISGDNSQNIYPLNASYYLLLGYGPADEGVLRKHQVFPQISPIMTNVATDFFDVYNPVTTPTPSTPVSTPSPASPISVSSAPPPASPTSVSSTTSPWSPTSVSSTTSLGLPTSVSSAPPPASPTSVSSTTSPWSPTSVSSTTSPWWPIFISDGNGSQVTFTAMPGSNQVWINMTSTVVSSPGWLGVGFSNDTVMQNDSVIDCIILPNGTIIVKHSYNYFHSNIEIPGASEGITNVTVSKANGVLQCIFQRQITGLSNRRIYNLNTQYRIMIAHGPVNNAGIKQFHFGKYITPQAKTVASSSFEPMNFSSFCDGDGNCAAFRYLNNSNEIQFQITGPVNGTGRWIALGFSNDNLMGSDSVLDCILAMNGTVMVQHSYNADNTVNKSNIALNSVEGITLVETSYANGTLNCSFRSQVSGFSDQRIYSLDKSYFLLLARGRVADDGMKKWHEKLPIISAYPVDVRQYGSVPTAMDLNQTAPPPAPGQSGWSSFNDPGSGNTVQFRLSDDGNYVEFTIQGSPQGGGTGWVAVGFGDNPVMVNSSVIDCILMSDGTFKVQLSYNQPSGGDPKNVVIGNPDSAIIDVTTQTTDGSMMCSLKRKISGFSDPRIFPFTKTYYLLLASGPINSDGVKQQHAKRVPSGETYNLTSIEGKNASGKGRSHSNAPDPDRLLRAHGVLMITTFVMLMSGGIILARYYKNCWPEDKLCGTGVWFAVHRFLMVLGLFCCAAGFIIIFCYGDGFIYRGFSTGSPSYYWAHGPMGIVVMILIIVNPLMAIFRCDPDHDLRWIYNWLHFTVGMCCQILGGITLFFGIKMGELYYNLNHRAVFWLLIAFVGFHVFIEFILIIEKIIAQRQTKKSFTVSYGMSARGEDPSAFKEGSEGPTRESLIFRYVVLAIYATVTMELWLAMIILVGGSFSTATS